MSTLLSEICGVSLFVHDNLIAPVGNMDGTLPDADKVINPRGLAILSESINSRALNSHRYLYLRIYKNRCETVIS